MLEIKKEKMTIKELETVELKFKHNINCQIKLDNSSLHM